MTMTPEEKFNKNVWHVLRQIREKSLYAKKGDLIEYEVDFNLVAAGYPSADEEAAILGKLEEWGVIRIKNPGGTWQEETPNYI